MQLKARNALLPISAQDFVVVAWPKWRFSCKHRVTLLIEGSVRVSQSYRLGRMVERGRKIHQNDEHAQSH